MRRFPAQLVQGIRGRVIYHEFQECKGFKGIDPPGEDTVFAIDFFNELNKETNIFEEDEKLAKKL